MNLKPLNDRVIVRQDAEVTKIGSIIVPDQHQEKPLQGEVLAVGTGAILKDGSRRPLDVEVGDRVLFNIYSGQKVEIDGEELLVLRENDIHAKCLSP